MVMEHGHGHGHGDGAWHKAIKKATPHLRGRQVNVPCARLFFSLASDKTGLEKMARGIAIVPREDLGHPRVNEFLEKIQYLLFSDVTCFVRDNLVEDVLRDRDSVHVSLRRMPPKGAVGGSILAYLHGAVKCSARTHALMHSCTHALMHSCTHALMHSCTHALMHSCTHALMHSCTRTKKGGSESGTA
jgi:hypothetical protein